MTVTIAWPETLEKISLLSRANAFEVWDCWDRTRVSRVVVKLPREERFGKESTLRQLTQEGALLQRLNHPHILSAYETIDGPVPIVVMETLGGETLAHTIDETGHLDTEETAHLGLQLCSALAYLHGEGFAHLDLKPSNIIGEAGRARLIDLGLARPFGDGRPGLGTWSYMAPEQVSGEGLGPATDVWGLGGTLFECICGHPPFDDPEIEGLGSRTGSATDSESSYLSGSETVSGTDGDWPGTYPQLERAARINGEAAGSNPDLDRLVLRCLDPEPAARPTLKTVAAGLEEILGIPEADRRHSRSIPS